MKSIYAINKELFQVVIVNDGISDIQLNSTEVSLTITRNKGAKGVAGARNTGASEAIFPFLLFLDDDMLVTQSALQRVYDYASNQYLTNSTFNFNWTYPPNLLNRLRKKAFGRYLISNSFTTMKGWCGENWKEEPLFELGSAAGANMLISKHVFFEVGMYSEHFPFAGFEDYDFSKRLEKKGVKMMVDQSVSMYHNESDKIFLKTWMNRKISGQITRYVGVQNGYDELDLNIPWYKRIVYALIYITRQLWFNSLSSLPAKYYSGLYERLINLLHGSVIFGGYYIEAPKWWKKNIRST